MFCAHMDFLRVLQFPPTDQNMHVRLTDHFVVKSTYKYRSYKCAYAKQSCSHYRWYRHWGCYGNAIVTHTNWTGKFMPVYRPNVFALNGFVLNFPLTLKIRFFLYKYLQICSIPTVFPSNAFCFYSLTCDPENLGSANVHKTYKMLYWQP